jgi:chaperonin cofactor prefoldin
MKRTPPPPSTRLLRAAAAEREQLERHRSELMGTRETLRAELERIEDGLREVDERRRLLDRLAPDADGPAPAAAAPTAPEAAGAAAGPDGATLLRGPAIRETAVRVLLEHPEGAQAMHYREWFELVASAGYRIAGKDPLAVFLTQLSRSPALRRGTRSGVYELDLAAETRLRARLDRLHDELRALTSGSSPTADLRTIRARRAELTAEIGQVEKALEELSRVLAPAA